MLDQPTPCAHCCQPACVPSKVRLALVATVMLAPVILLMMPLATSKGDGSLAGGFLGDGSLDGDGEDFLGELTTDGNLYPGTPPAYE